MERQVRLNLLNQEFTVQTSLSDADLAEIVELVQQEIDELCGPRKQLIPTGKTLVLACLQLAARLVSLRREHDSYRSQQESRIDDIIHRVNDTIPDDVEI